MTLFFTSDHHFWHNNIIQYCNRPFSSVTEMNEILIERWNNVIKKGDVVYYLGDFSFSKPDMVKPIIEKLNGTKIFLPGNHDSAWFGKLEQSRNLLFVESIHQISHMSQKVVLCHYAMRSWDRSHHGAWHLFGHHHGSMPPYGKSFDVGVDTHVFYPYSWDEIAEKMKSLPETREI